MIFIEPASASGGYEPDCLSAYGGSYLLLYSAMYFFKFFSMIFIEPASITACPPTAEATCCSTPRCIFFKFFSMIFIEHASITTCPLAGIIFYHSIMQSFLLLMSKITSFSNHIFRCKYTKIFNSSQIYKILSFIWPRAFIHIIL